MNPRRGDWALAALALAAVLLGSCKDCADVCDDLKAYQRFPCARPPFMLCDGNGEAAKPLNKEDVEYIRGHCGDCSSCSPCGVFVK
jgi:hypothetical protein